MIFIFGLSSGAAFTGGSGAPGPGPGDDGVLISAGEATREEVCCLVVNYLAVCAGGQVSGAPPCPPRPVLPDPVLVLSAIRTR